MSFVKSNIVKVTIQENTDTVQVSFVGEHIQSTDFHPGDVLILSNIEHRKWGQLHALQGKTDKRSVNPTDPDCSPYLPTANTPCIDMSPAKDKAKSITVRNMVGTTGRMSVIANIINTNINEAVYDKCLLLSCKSKVLKLDNGLFKCAKCGHDYLARAYGMKLMIDLFDNTNSSNRRSLVLFNEKAEDFLQATADEINTMFTDEKVHLETQVRRKKFTFTVSSSKTGGNYV